jgi:pyruvate/2-oxoglutarate dehydrogenase complex dihydrolipoamide dehydrogenase (E3) component
MPEKGSVVVVGSGAAGRACARSLARSGWHVTLAEKDRWGGTCLWRGCIPKKALYHSARLARDLRSAEQFGVRCGSVEVDWQSVLAWKWHAQETYAGDQRALLTAAGIDLAEGTARFVAEDAIEVDDRHVRFDHAVIATGSRASGLAVPGAELTDTSDDALRYPELPRSLTIVGGGFIAMELAAVFGSLGTTVSVLTRPDRVLDMLDAELATIAARRLDDLGVAVATGCSVGAVSGSPGALTVTATDASGNELRVDAERVLVATGRTPVLDGLELDAAGVAVDDKGRLVLDAHARTTNPRIWAAGDVTGGQMHTPVANYEGRVIAQAIDSGHPGFADCADVPITCFTYPELATVGLTEADAAASGTQVEVRRVHGGEIGAGVIEEWRDALVKVVFDAESRRVLGMQAAGPTASDIIYAGAVAIRTGMTAEQLGDTLAVHPSMADAFYYAGG